MESSNPIRSNKNFRVIAIVTGALGLLYLLINLFAIGGDEFVYSLNNFITIPLTLFTALFSFSMWRVMLTNSNSRRLWGSLMAGWAMWTIAEILWVVYGYVYQEIPYPSPADFFWLVGYIPMGYGLYMRVRGISIRLRPFQTWTLWAIIAGTVAATWAFIVLPILQTNDPSNALESALNISYPLVDLFLLIVVLRLFFIFSSGGQGLGWNLLTVGFILHSISNLVFSYASLSDIYYPDLQVNLISGALIDAPYNISYLLWGLGLYALRLTWSMYRPFEETVSLQPVPNTSILVFLDRENKAIEAGNNFGRIFGVDDVKGKSLAELLRMTDQDASSILATIRREGKITDFPVQVETRVGASQGTYVTGATLNPKGEYSGCVLLFRILFDDDYSLDETLNDYQKGMVSHVRRLCESSERANIRKLLLDYHLAYLKPIYNIVFQTGGAQIGEAFLEQLSLPYKYEEKSVIG
jgi:hypothetical protein